MERGINTRCLHLEEDEGKFDNYGAISYPIYQTATFAHPGVGQSTGFDYTRAQNPTKQQLEKIVASLEKGSDAFALSSGMAAISLVMELFQPGDHILVESDLYGGSIRLFDHVTKKNGISVTAVNANKDNVEEFVQENTKAIYIETPTNPMMNVIDIQKLAEIAKEHGLLLIVDNTFLSPYFQNPLELGADLVIHSGTKYLGGHNDTLAGFVVAKDEKLVEKLDFLSKTIGSGLAPFDCWLILRGIKTLGIRMKQAQENAFVLGKWFREQKLVKKVIYPGFEDHPGHDILKRQARGFGAIITVELDNKEHALELLSKVRMIKYAESLGGVETLVTYPATQTHADVPEEIRIKNGITDGTLRFSIGIEDAEDLVRELEQIFQEIEK